MTHRDSACILCGHTSIDVAFGLIAWREPVGRDVFTSAPRCKDAVSCRARVEAAGEKWEVFEKPLTTRELLERDRR